MTSQTLDRETSPPRLEDLPPPEAATADSVLPPPVLPPAPPEPWQPPKPERHWGRWISIAVGVVFVLWAGINAWQDQRQAEQAKQDLRDIGFSEQSLDDFEDLGESVQAEIDVNDGVVTAGEITAVRLIMDRSAQDGLITSALHDDYTDAELEELAIESCGFVAEASSAQEFEAMVLAADGLDFDKAFLRGVLMGSACLDDTEGLLGP